MIAFETQQACCVSWQHQMRQNYNSNTTGVLCLRHRLRMSSQQEHERLKKENDVLKQEISRLKNANKKNEEQIQTLTNITVAQRKTNTELQSLLQMLWVCILIVCRTNLCGWLFLVWLTVSQRRHGHCSKEKVSCIKCSDGVFSW